MGNEWPTKLSEAKKEIKRLHNILRDAHAGQSGCGTRFACSGPSNASFASCYRQA